MQTSELAKLRNLLKDTTPGTWWSDDGCVAVGFGDEYETIIDGNLQELEVSHNAEFIAFAHNCMPQLLAIAEAAQNLIKQNGRYNTEKAYKRLKEALDKQYVSQFEDAVFEELK